MTHRTPLLPTLLLSLLSACATFAPRHHDLGLRHDEENDTIELLIVQRAVTLAEKAKLETALEHIDGILARRRTFGTPDWMFQVDLDDVQDDEEIAPADRHLLEGITVEDAGAFLDASGRLAWYQRVRIRRAGRVVERLNEMINDGIAGEVERRPAAGNAYDGTAELWREAVREPWTWVRFEGETLVVRIPTTAAGAAEALRDLVATEDDESAFLQALLAPMSGLTVADSVARLEFAPTASASGILWLQLDLVEQEYDERLLSALPEGAVRADLTLEEVRALLTRGR